MKELLAFYGTNEQIFQLVGLLITAFGAGFGIARIIFDRWPPHWVKVERKERQLAEAALADAKKELANAATQTLSQKTQRQNLRTEVSNLRAQVHALTDERDTFSERVDHLLADDGKLWSLRENTSFPGHYAQMARSRDRTRVITVGNLKGGVGKTTLVANLAAYFEKVRNKRVLVIDLDHQGSQSDFQADPERPLPNTSPVAQILLGNTDAGITLAGKQKLDDGLKQCWLLPSSYDLNEAENRLLMRWLIDDADTDLRYRLHNFIRDERVQNSFDVILLDTPPRMSPAMVNALCASHNLIVPTATSLLSSVATPRFIQHVTSLTENLNPGLEITGIVLNFTAGIELSDTDKDAVATMKSTLKDQHLPGYVLESHMRRLDGIATAAGRKNKYLTDRLFSEGIINKIGDELWDRLQLPEDPNEDRSAA